MPVTRDSMQQLLEFFNHCRVLGMQVEALEGKRVTLSLPYSDRIVGNPVNGIIHGGALTTLLDTTCGMGVAAGTGMFQVAPTLDLRIDYMTAAQPGETVFASAEAFRVSRSVIFCRGVAYQHDESSPIAHCTTTFMRLTREALENRPAGGEDER